MTNINLHCAMLILLVLAIVGCDAPPKTAAMDYDVINQNDIEITEFSSISGMLTGEDMEFSGWYAFRYPSGDLKLLQYFAKGEGQYTRTYAPSGEVLHSSKVVHGNGTVLYLDDEGQFEKFNIYCNDRYISIKNPECIKELLQQWNEH